MSLPDDALDIIERAFAAKRYDYQTITLDASKRRLRVVIARGAPSATLTTYISFDGLLVDAWKGVLPDKRLLPIVPVSRPKDDDGAFHAAWLLDAALSMGAPPRPREIFLDRGHSPALPHVRWDYPFPWEKKRPLQIALGELTVIPVLAYSVSDAEAKRQLEAGPEALEAHFTEAKVTLFDRRRASSL